MNFISPPANSDAATDAPRERSLFQQTPTCIEKRLQTLAEKRKDQLLAQQKERRQAQIRENRKKLT